MIKIWVSVILCAGCAVAAGQSFRLERELGPVEADGFYRIDLSPEIIPDVNATFSNVRIMDAGGKEVPYLLRQEQPASYSTVFRPYHIVQYEQRKNCCTSIILENPDNKAINNIHLSIRNADVAKEMVLTGSDDKQNWYALKSRSMISAAGDGEKTSTMRLVDFPMSNYAYYKIEIGDSTSAPLNITAAGYFEVNTAEGRYSAVPFEWHQTDSAAMKETFIRITFGRSQVMDRITLSMKGTPYFLRRGTLLREVRPSKAGAKSYYDRVASFIVSSRQPAVIDLRGERGNEFVMAIENEDNPVLKVDNLRVDQLNRYLVAWLAKGSYGLKFGAPDLQASRYDLVNFSDSIPASLVSLKAGPSKAIEPARATESTTIFTNPIVIWVAIVAVIGVLGFMAIRMTREM
ncbi:MAG TPA: hypothetical protein VK658_26955 [Chryseolinea sp.]|nr:hypothetical protein [Chryseolinea sp.]